MGAPFKFQSVESRLALLPLARLFHLHSACAKFDLQCQCRLSFCGHRRITFRIWERLSSFSRWKVGWHFCRWRVCFIYTPLAQSLTFNASAGSAFAGIVELPSGYGSAFQVSVGGKS